MTRTNSDGNLLPALVLLVIAGALAVLSVMLFGGWTRVSQNLPMFLGWLLLGVAAFYTGMVVVTIAVRALLRLGSPK